MRTRISRGPGVGQASGPSQIRTAASDVLALPIGIGRHANLEAIDTITAPVVENLHLLLK